uniref:inorganic diphosphatase n=1 Tax=Guillardia theta TaxID=55529 RepID=A0PCY4_GUITH|nr:pyrophosphatase [Guillardia theta]
MLRISLVLALLPSAAAFSGAFMPSVGLRGSHPLSIGARRVVLATPSSRSERARIHVSPITRMSYSTKEKGSFPSEEYRCFFEKDGKVVSPWHGIPTWADKDKNIVNAVIEITKNTRPKMEVATKEESNPIKQDMKKGKLRDYPLDIFWNYGMIPQTWENPKHEHPELKAFGDNDPVDIVEIGSSPIPRGQVVSVKALGTLAMIDRGELDWEGHRRLHR